MKRLPTVKGRYLDRGEWRVDLVAASTKALKTCVTILDDVDPKNALAAAAIIIKARTDLALYDVQDDAPADLGDFNNMTSTELTTFVRRSLAGVVVDVKTKQ